MKKLLSLLLAVALLFAPCHAFADGTVTLPAPPTLQPGEPSVGAVISPLKKNQRAPFTGLLLSPEAVAQVLVNLQNEQNETDIQINKARDTQKAQDQLVIDDLNSQLTYQKTTDQTQIQSLNDRLSSLDKQLQASESNKPNLPIWVGAGAVGGIVVTVITVFALSKATK